MSLLSEAIDQQLVDDCVEAICDLGCRRVGEIIHQLEHEEPVVETSHLDAHARHAVLTELKSIMAVYGGVCRF